MLDVHKSDMSIFGNKWDYLGHISAHLLFFYLMGNGIEAEAFVYFLLLCFALYCILVLKQFWHFLEKGGRADVDFFMD